MANGLPTEGKDDQIVNTAKIRALEISYFLSHDRPNGDAIWDLDDRCAGENISSADFFVDGSGKRLATNMMNRWKNSYGHNLNMLHEDAEPIVGISVFINMSIEDDGVAEERACFGVQFFGTNEEINWDF